MTKSKQYYPGNSVTRLYQFKDLEDNLYDPTSITVTITDADDSIIDVISADQLTRLAKGEYKLWYNLPKTTTSKGVWHITIHATYIISNLDDTAVFDFNVTLPP